MVDPRRFDSPIPENTPIEPRLVSPVLHQGALAFSKCEEGLHFPPKSLVCNTIFSRRSPSADRLS